ncbi:conserved hypothetical protein [Gloeothece citriformis PCC 7424]|uniref:Uncharacterized protein n=1 Tax=Gloeothece citriformis (strain PCC 7424) TaxID=65393 RepID=B7KG59_GLOC7|nr:hypothetical protein [Gloeothece citriformis]ACK70530.1 conserved hypothetical protein [Gloeothece citriformis PCC 7424]
MSPLSSQEKLSWYDVSQEVKNLLILASENWENTVLSEQYVTQALALADNNLDVLIGAYRFFFYKGKSLIALEVADQVLGIIQTRKNLPPNWEDLQLILSQEKDDPLLRLYLNAYAAKGFLLAKLGRLDEAKLITERVKKLDEHREFCATTVFDVLTRLPQEEE